jgi:CMP-N-acetylneuraminic acid synthetase
MNAFGIIFARGGSKGLPGKNIRNLAGKPLIAWSIEHARDVKRIERVIVSTDSEEIASVARDFGAEVPFLRPQELARDDAPEWLAWQHALSFLQETEGSLPSAMISIPPTAPLRLPFDLENCLNEFEKGEVDVVITVSDAHRSPWFNMVKRNQDGSVGLVMETPISITRRQDAPEVFDMATVAYVARPDFVLKRTGIFSGKVGAVKVPVERAIDIDTIFDFELAEFLVSRRGF